jgi:hypothetical protein
VQAELEVERENKEHWQEQAFALMEELNRLKGLLSAVAVGSDGTHI